MKYIKKFENKTESDLEKLESLKDAFTEISDHWEVRFYFNKDMDVGYEYSTNGITSVIKLKREDGYTIPYKMDDNFALTGNEFGDASNYFQEISKLMQLLDECVDRVKFDILESEIFYYSDNGESPEAGSEDYFGEKEDWSDKLTLFFKIKY
jgi:hypothetical protein